MDAGVVRQFFALEYWKTRPIVSSVGQASGLAVSSLRVPSVLNLRSSSMPAGSAPPVLSLGSSSVAAEPTFSMNVNLGFSSMVA